MRVLLIGNGGREHALGLKIIQDDPGAEVHIAPGNPGLEDLGVCHWVAVNDVAGSQQTFPDFPLWIIEALHTY